MGWNPLPSLAHPPAFQVELLRARSLQPPSHLGSPCYSAQTTLPDFLSHKAISAASAARVSPYLRSSFAYHVTGSNSRRLTTRQCLFVASTFSLTAPPEAPVSTSAALSPLLLSGPVDTSAPTHVIAYHTVKHRSNPRLGACSEERQYSAFSVTLLYIFSTYSTFQLERIRHTRQQSTTTRAQEAGYLIAR